MNYKLLGKRTGLPVSEFALGAGNFGQAWGYGTDPIEADRIVSSNPLCSCSPSYLCNANYGGVCKSGYKFGTIAKKKA